MTSIWPHSSSAKKRPLPSRKRSFRDDSSPVERAHGRSADWPFSKFEEQAKGRGWSNRASLRPYPRLRSCSGYLSNTIAPFIYSEPCSDFERRFGECHSWLAAITPTDFNVARLFVILSGFSGFQNFVTYQTSQSNHDFKSADQFSVTQYFQFPVAASILKAALPA